MTSTLSDLLGHGEALVAITAEDEVLAAMCVIRHARNIGDARMLHEMLGLEPQAAGRCPDCGNPDALADHDRTCGPASAERIMSIAGRIR